MELIVTRGERTERVAVRRTASGWEVGVGEETHAVEAVPVGGDVWSLRLGGAQHEVAVRALPAAGPTGGGDRYEVTTATGSAPVEIVDPLTHLARASRGGAGRRGATQVTAYMPGRVVQVLVEEGAEVTAGQGVLVLEAMKMENEIAAEDDGVVKRILVEPGQAVEGGDPLFEVE